jgi:hypothetical protein
VLLDKVLPYIRSGNAGMDDALYDAADAACHDDAGGRDLSERVEALGRDWPIDHARRIYRRLVSRKWVCGMVHPRGLASRPLLGMIDDCVEAIR